MARIGCQDFEQVREKGTDQMTVQKLQSALKVSIRRIIR